MPGFAGYLWGKAAMHPSVCALRRIHRPVCGARIALRALKHTCVLRPLHLLRLAFSAAGGARLRSPLQGRLWRDRHPEGSPVRGAVGVSRLRGAAPCLANILPVWRKAPDGRERPPYNARQTDGGTGGQAWRADDGRGVSPLCVGADACIGPPAGLTKGWRLCVAARPRPQHRAHGRHNRERQVVLPRRPAPKRAGRADFPQFSQNGAAMGENGGKSGPASPKLCPKSGRHLYSGAARC